MVDFRKPRSDSRLANLPEDDRTRLLEWFTTPGMSLSEIRKLCELDAEKGGLGVKTSTGALSAWWSKHGPEFLIARRSQARSLANDLAEEAKANPAQFEAATIDSIQQQAFTMAQQPGVQPKDVKALFSLILKVRDQEVKRQELALADRRVALLERKAKQAEEAEGIASDGKLSAQEKEARIKAVFGLA